MYIDITNSIHDYMHTIAVILQSILFRYVHLKRPILILNTTVIITSCDHKRIIISPLGIEYPWGTVIKLTNIIKDEVSTFYPHSFFDVFTLDYSTTACVYHAVTITHCFCMICTTFKGYGTFLTIIRS